MRIGWGRQVAAGFALVAVSGTWAERTPAQDAGGSAFSVTGTIRSTVEIDDNSALVVNSPGTDLSFGTAIDLLATLETPRSLLTFGIGGTFQAEDLAAGREENGFQNPSAVLEYRLEGPDSLLSVSADYSKDDVADSFSADTDADLIPDLFLSSVGEVERYGVAVELSYGIEAPFGVDVALSRRERNYSNTVSPSLFDTTTDRARLTARFRPTETVTTRVFVEEERYEADDSVSTDRTTRTIGAGLDYEINPVLTFSGELGFVDVDERTIVLGTPVVVTSEDYSIDASLTQELPNGTIALLIARDIGTNIARTELGVEREMELPTGALSFGLGVSDGDPGDTIVTGFVDYVHEFPSAVLALSASRTAQIASDNDQSQTSRLGVIYNRELTRTSGVVLELDYVDTQDIGLGGATEGSRTDLSVTYRQELTEDWDWTVGYRGRRTEDSAGATATSNALVFSVGRSFSLRP